MRLDRLIAAERAQERAAIEITGLAYDSRQVSPGDLFFCVRGFEVDGHDYAPQAVRAGAAALVVERPLDLGVPEILVASAREQMGPIADRFFEHPSSQLEVLGVTGTNGKTTTAFLLRALLQASGQTAGLLGTVKSVIGGQDRPVLRTTAEAIDLQRDLRAMLDAGDHSCAIEVSSHALELGRTDGVRFAAAIFTNLTQDHLDFHPTMETYFQAKRRLFVPPDGAGPRLSVINLDDGYGRRLASELAGPVTTFALEDPGADYRASDLRCGARGCQFRLHTPAGSRDVALGLPGRFNVANALGALAAVHALGGELDSLLAILERGVHVPGRFEPVDCGQGFAVLIDYAHTPDSLANVLAAARELTDSGGRVICVFGAGGDRDRGKRPLMGEIAARMSDLVIVTSDNPRSESPPAIVEQIVAGIAPEHRPRAQVEVDRRAAIELALDLARPGDVVVIAGKGHEQGQELAQGRKIPFDDATVAREALRAGTARRADEDPGAIARAAGGASG